MSPKRVLKVDLSHLAKCTEFFDIGDLTGNLSLRFLLTGFYSILKHK